MKKHKNSKEVIQKMREWDALPIEEKLKKIEEMKKKGLKVYGEEGDDIIDEEFPKFNDVVSSKRLRKDVLKDREEYYKNIKDNGWDDPIEYSDFDDYLQNEINEMRNETTKGKKMKKEIKREYALMIAGEGGGTELLRVYYEDGTSQFMDERSRLNGASNVLLDDDDIRYDHVDVYFDTFDDYWDRMFPKNDGWWNLGFFTKTEDVYVLVKEKFISELSKLNFSSHDIELITNNRVNRDFGKIK